MARGGLEPIDVVITWVDDSDPIWREERDYWKARVGHTTFSNNVSSTVRYRDWGTLCYVFRGIEKFAPWVNRVFFVTYGHLPEWLNVNCNRLVVVDHKDFIPKQYLPTFSSVAIEFCFNRIAGLSERFIYFNDDTFLISKVDPEDYFVGNLPVLIPAETAITLSEKDLFFTQMVNAAVINEHFEKRTIRRRDWYKWFSPKLPPKVLAENALLCAYPSFKAFEDRHGPSPYLKSAIDLLWEEEHAMLDYACSERFRPIDSANLWLAKCWQIAEGNYVVGKKLGSQYPRRNTEFSSETKAMCDVILNQADKVICIGEQSCTEEQFASRVKAVGEAFESILPEKSSFEK